MKIRWLVMSLVLLMLWGCAAPPEPEPLPATEPEGTAVATEPAVPSVLYDPDHHLEAVSSGALRVHPLELDCVQGIRFLGQDILVFSGADRTLLTLLTGENCSVSAQMLLPCAVSPGDLSTVVSPQGITYLDRESNAFVTLDHRLRMRNRSILPDRVTGPVGLAPDCSALYYCGEDGLRLLDPKTTTSRLLAQMDFAQLALTGIHCDGAVLECTVTDSDGQQFLRFVSAQTGTLLKQTPADLTIHTVSDHYFAIRNQAPIPEYLTGSEHYGPSMLVTEVPAAHAAPVTGAPGLVLSAQEGDSTTLYAYDLETGVCRSQLTLPGLFRPEHVLADPEGCLWFLLSDDDASPLLCRWDPRCSPSQDTHCDLQPLYSPESPDLEGLAHCRELAATLSRQYDVTVLLWEDALSSMPWDYSFVPEHRVPVLEFQLARLEEALSRYPDGFLKKAAAGTGSGKITLCLVRQISGVPGTGALEQAGGIQYWDQDSNAFVALATDCYLPRDVSHELFHIFESRVFSTCDAYDGWSKLNPGEFAYTCDYTQPPSPGDTFLLEGEDRAFVDFYAMSYPREDRARIMEYAMLPSQEDLFSSQVMQQKLRTLCLGIREAFGLKTKNGPYLWEQYLKEPIA